MEITNRDDLRVGDIATFTYRGHEFTGEVWSEREGSLIVGPDIVRYSDGAWSDYFTFVRATREMPPLPTEPGSVIEIITIDDHHIEPTVAMLDDANDWMLAVRRDERWTLTPYRITAWRPMKVVPA